MTDLDVESALRTTRPHKVVAILDDDREVTIAIPRGTRRWERMAATLASQSWTELRCFDKAGGLMAPPLVRDQAARAPAAPGLEELTGGASDRLVDSMLVERLVRTTMDVAMRSFVEVAKVMRSSGSSEVTAALQANRETLNAIGSHADDLRRQLADQAVTIAELERELAVRLANDVPKQIEQSPTERLVERFASGFIDGAAGGGNSVRKPDSPEAGH